MSKYKVGDRVLLKHRDKCNFSPSITEGMKDAFSASRKLRLENRCTTNKHWAVSGWGDGQYWNIHEDWIDRKVGEEKQDLTGRTNSSKKHRQIRGRIFESTTKTEEEEAPQKLREVTINKGEIIILNFGEKQVRVKLDHLTCYEDKKTKNQVVKITGLIIPEEKVLIRKIRK